MIRVKRFNIDTFPENVAFLSRNCDIYRAEDFRALERIEVCNTHASILATLYIVDDPELVPNDQLGLSSDAFRRLGLKEGESVEIRHPGFPKSLSAIRRKVAGETLTAEMLHDVMRDIAAHRYSKMELAAYVVASAGFMTSQEVLDSTRAMAAVGDRLKWERSIVVDKHCIGGIPGNRTSMIVVPIVAAHGLAIPKTSSRAITSPAGTADTMEVLANVDVDEAQMRHVVSETNGCLVWGGHANLSPADDVLISVERPLGIDTREQMVASILSKKIAAGSTHLLIDIPVGPSAKVRSREDAIRLRKLFEFVGDQVGLLIDVAITDGSQPIGRGIGPVLEARDVMQVLRNEPEAPHDLRDRALLLAGQVLEFDMALRGGAGYQRAKHLLESGEALKAMERIIENQGPPPGQWSIGRLSHDVPAGHDGRVTAIDCHRMARIARLAGAPMDKGAGIDLLKKNGDTVTKGEPLYRIHAHIDADFNFAVEHATEDTGYTIDGSHQGS